MMLSLLLGSILLLQATPESDRFVEDDLDAASLQLEAHVVLGVFREHLGVDLADRVTFRLSDPEELNQILTDELLPQMRARIAASAVADVTARQMARALSTGLFAKYATGSREILVCVDNLITVSERATRPELLARETLRAILLHECVHAVDHERYDWPAVLTSLKSNEAMQCYNAMIEGHAQLVARDLATRCGWSKGFDDYTEMIGFAPDDDSAIGQQLRILAATQGTSYHAGERFLSTLRDAGRAGEAGEAGGAAAIDAALADPPQELELLFQPEWYLDPAGREQVTGGLKRGLAPLRESIDPAEWTIQLSTIGTEQIRASIAILPEEDVDRIAAGLKANRVLVANPKAGLSGVAMVGSLIAFEDAAEAAFYRDAMVRMHARKLDTMATGPIHLVSATSEDLSGEGWRGFYVTSLVNVMGKDVTVHNVVVIDGDTAVELLYSNVAAADRDSVIAMAERMRQAAGRAPIDGGGP